MAAGIEVRHRTRCKVKANGSGCNCAPAFRAVVFDKSTGRKIARSFATEAAAKSWRKDAYAHIGRGTLPTTTAQVTLGEAFEQWARDADAGKVRKRNRAPFAPSTIRSVRQNWSLRLADAFGTRRLECVTLLELQDFVDELEADGTHPGTIETTILPLRLLYRRAKTRGLVTVDPTDGLELPMKSKGVRVPPSPGHALRLLDGLPDAERPLWATAMFTGLRRGELLALQWEDINLDAGTLHVRRSYNPSHGYGPPKSVNGVRTVPIGRRLAPVLRLREHMLRTGRRDGLVFSTNGETPPDPTGVQARADRAWTSVGLERVTLHACRHLYASMSIAAGVNAHALCKYMGHSSIAITFDLYGHMFPGNEAEAAELLDAYLDASAG